MCKIGRDDGRQGSHTSGGTNVSELERTSPHRKVIADVTRDFRNNQFASLSIRQILPDDMTLAMTMMCTAEVDT